MADITGTSAGETLQGTTGDDTINALGGDDSILFSSGNDIVDGGEGYDSLTWDSPFFDIPTGINLVHMNGVITSSTINSSTTYSNIEQIYVVTNNVGTGADDFIDLRGFDGDSQIFTYGGNDTIYIANGVTLTQAGEGNDTVHITGADNTVYGEGGDDIFVLEAGMGLNNQIFGGAGFDTLDVRNITAENTGAFQISAGDFEQILGSEIDEVWFEFTDTDHIFYGNGGNDVLRTGAGDDQLFGGDGDDLLEGGAGVDTFDGGDGFDRISFDFVADQATQGIVADLRTQTILNDGFGNTEQLTSIEGLGAGSNLADTFDGDDNDNLIFAGAGDTVRLHGGDDIAVIQSEGTAAIVDGGDGVDQLSMIFGPRASWTQGVTIDFNTNTIVSQNPTLTFANFENAAGTAFGDTLIGDVGANVLEGREGNDTLDGGAGGDTLDGGAGSDVLTGGDQNDNLFGGAGNDQLLGQRGADFLYGGDGNDLLLGGNRNDRLFGEDGNDRVFGGNDNDVVEGGGGIDIGRGGNGDDILSGGADGDVLFGGTGRDTINGDEGNDFLFGRGGFDILNGGAGDDTLEGGVQADQFIFSDGFGNDVITDFASLANGEKIHLTDVAAITDFQDLIDNHMSQIGGDVVIDDGLGNTITLLGINLADLDTADFVF